MKRILNQTNRIEVEELTEKYVNNFINQKVLIETADRSIIGTLNKFKGNYAIFIEDIVNTSFTLNDIIKISGRNSKTNLLETIVKCGSGGNQFCVKSKKGKNLGGPYKSKEAATKRIKQVEYFKHIKEDQDLLLKENLLYKFFKINEEVVNPDNVGKLKPQKSNPRAKRRDKIAKSKDNKAVSLPGSGDTDEEANIVLQHT